MQTVFVLVTSSWGEEYHWKSQRSAVDVQVLQESNEASEDALAAAQVKSCLSTFI